MIQKQAVQPNAVTFRCDAPLPADSTVRENLDSASAPQTQDYLLEVFGTTQLDWTAEQMARQTEVSGLLDEENTGTKPKKLQRRKMQRRRKRLLRWTAPA